MSGNGYKTITEIAKAADVSAKTIYRYLKRYPQFFRVRQVDGFTMLPREESLLLIKRINEISRSGQRRRVVLSQIEKEFEVVEPVQPAQPHAREKSSVPTELLYVLQEIRDELREIKGGLKAVSEGMAK